MTLDGLAMVWGTERLAGLAVVSAILDEMIRAEVTELREHGSSWSEIGASLGISKQAAQQKYRTVKAD